MVKRTGTSFTPASRLSRLRKAIFALVAVCLALAGLEGGLRAAAWLYDLPARTLLPAGGGGDRIIAAGDSVTFGFALPARDSYPAQLSRLEAVRASGARVVNLGTSGRGLNQVVDDLERVLAGPARGRAEVLLLAGFNDCSYLRSAPALLPLPSPEVEAVRDALGTLRAYRVLTQVAIRLRAAAMGAPPGRRRRPVDAHLERCRGAVRQGLARAAALDQRREVTLRVLTYPVPLLSATTADDGQWVSTEVNHALRQAAADQGLRLLDLVPCVQERERVLLDRFFMPDGLHLTRQGYAAMARCALEGLSPGRYGGGAGLP